MITDVFPAWNTIPENNIFIKKVLYIFKNIIYINLLPLHLKYSTYLNHCYQLLLVATDSSAVDINDDGYVLFRWCCHYYF